MVTAPTLHIATGEYVMEPAFRNSNPLALASVYRVLQPLPDPAPPVPRRVDVNSPAVIRRNERDFAGR